MLVKICGITTEADALLAVGPRRRRRRVHLRPVAAPGRAPGGPADHRADARPRSSPSGCSATRPAPGWWTSSTASACAAAQLHGDETAEDTAWVAARVPFTIKAFPAGHRNIARIDDYGVEPCSSTPRPRDRARCSTGAWPRASSTRRASSSRAGCTPTTWPTPSPICIPSGSTCRRGGVRAGPQGPREGAGLRRRGRAAAGEAPTTRPTAEACPTTARSRGGPSTGRRTGERAVMGEPSADGRFGEFGGRFVPESLVPACMELEAAFRAAWADPGVPRRATTPSCATTAAGRPR